MFVDSHCHLHMIDYEKLGLSQAQVLDQAATARVAHMLCVATKLGQMASLKALAQNPRISISIGVHPCDTDTAFDVNEFLRLAHTSSVVAIGETGLDYSRSDADACHLQRSLFAQHIEVAKLTRKPLIIHTRQAKKDTLAILESEHAREVGGVFHCFTEDYETAKAALDLGFYISLSGILTFKSATDLQSLASRLPLDRLLIETDSPYLAPQTMRGRINVPAYVVEVAQKLADLCHTSIELVAEKTRENFNQLFNLKVEPI